MGYEVVNNDDDIYTCPIDHVELIQTSEGV